MGKNNSKRKGKNKDKPREAATEQEAVAQQPKHQLPATVGAKPPQNTDQGQPPSQTTKEKRWWHKPPISQEWLKFSEVLFAGAVVFFTAVSLWMSTRAAQKNAEEAAQSAADTLREVKGIGRKLLQAYVHVDGIEVKPSDEMDQFVINMSIANDGGTRAHEIAISTGTAYGPITYPGPFETVAAQSPARLILGPGQLPFSNVVNVDISDTRRKALKDGEAVLWIFGRITYKDDFGQDRYTQYRYYYDGKQDRVLIAPEGNVTDQ